MNPPLSSRRDFLRTASTASVATFTFPHLASGAVPDKIKIGQIGTRHAHASGKMEAMRRLNRDFEVVGVVEPDASQRRRLENSPPYRGVKWMTVEQLLNASGLQAVAIETEVRDLVPSGIKSLQAGKHIHLDKPAGESLPACRDLHAEATRKKLTVQMGYMLRYNPAFIFLRDTLDQGWLGEITEVNGMMGKWLADGPRKELAQFKGGGMFELACHLIDALIDVLGEPSRVTPFTHRTFSEKDTFADNQLAVFDYPRALATIRCNHIDPMGFSRRRFEVTGTSGTLTIHPLEPPRVTLALDRPRGPFKKGTQEVPMPSVPGRYDGEFTDLAQVIRGQKNLRWDAGHDLAVHRAVLQAGGMSVD